MTRRPARRLVAFVAYDGVQPLDIVGPHEVFAAANALPDPVPEEVKEERYARVMALTARISAEKLAAKAGSTIDVLIDAVDANTGGAESVGATGRSKADAPEIDGEVHLRDAGHLAPGDIVKARIEDSDEHDLYGVALG